MTLSGLPANTTIKVKLAGVAEGESGTKVNQERKVTTDENGNASWWETIDWPVDTYATNVSWRIPGEQPVNTSATTLHVIP